MADLNERIDNLIANGERFDPAGHGDLVERFESAIDVRNSANFRLKVGDYTQQFVNAVIPEKGNDAYLVLYKPGTREVDSFIKCSKLDALGLYGQMLGELDRDVRDGRVVTGQGYVDSNSEERFTGGADAKTENRRRLLGDSGLFPLASGSPDPPQCRLDELKVQIEGQDIRLPASRFVRYDKDCLIPSQEGTLIGIGENKIEIGELNQAIEKEKRREELRDKEETLQNALKGHNFVDYRIGDKMTVFIIEGKDKEPARAFALSFGEDDKKNGSQRHMTPENIEEIPPEQAMALALKNIQNLEQGYREEFFDGEKRYPANTELYWANFNGKHNKQIYPNPERGYDYIERPAGYSIELNGMTLPGSRNLSSCISFPEGASEPHLQIGKEQLPLSEVINNLEQNLVKDQRRNDEIEQNNAYAASLQNEVTNDVEQTYKDGLGKEIEEQLQRMTDIAQRMTAIADQLDVSASLENENDNIVNPFDHAPEELVEMGVYTQSDLDVINQIKEEQKASLVKHMLLAPESAYHNMFASQFAEHFPKTELTKDNVIKIAQEQYQGNEEITNNLNIQLALRSKVEQQRTNEAVNTNPEKEEASRNPEPEIKPKPVEESQSKSDEHSDKQAAGDERTNHDDKAHVDPVSPEPLTHDDIVNPFDDPHFARDEPVQTPRMESVAGNHVANESEKPAFDNQEKDKKEFRIEDELKKFHPQIGVMVLLVESQQPNEMSYVAIDTNKGIAQLVTCDMKADEIGRKSIGADKAFFMAAKCYDKLEHRQINFMADAMIKDVKDNPHMNSIGINEYYDRQDSPAFKALKVLSIMSGVSMDKADHRSMSIANSRDKDEHNRVKFGHSHSIDLANLTGHENFDCNLNAVSKQDLLSDTLSEMGHKMADKLQTFVNGKPPERSSRHNASDVELLKENLGIVLGISRESTVLRDASHRSTHPRAVVAHKVLDALKEKGEKIGNINPLYNVVEKCQSLVEKRLDKIYKNVVEGYEKDHKGFKKILTEVRRGIVSALTQLKSANLPQKENPDLGR